MFKPYDTLVPYKVLDHKGIQYTYCRDYGHVSRYRGLRQVIHNPNDSDRFISLETSNPLVSHLKDRSNFRYYEVSATTECRLDLIAEKYLGSAQYSWVIAYFNGIEDGFTVREGQVLRFPKNISTLFNSGELLESVTALQLNLGEE